MNDTAHSLPLAKNASHSFRSVVTTTTTTTMRAYVVCMRVCAFVCALLALIPQRSFDGMMHIHHQNYYVGVRCVVGWVAAAILRAPECFWSTTPATMPTRTKSSTTMRRRG